MTLTDPHAILILLAGSFTISTISFLTGVHLRDIKARRDQRAAWAEAERLYRARSILDLRDNTPRP